MNNRAYLAVSGAVFLLVALAHLVRAVQNWPVQVSQWVVPVEVSWVGLVVTLTLAVWAFRLHGGSIKSSSD